MIVVMSVVGACRRAGATSADHGHRVPAMIGCPLMR
jgi:hypothetical protein